MAEERTPVTKEEGTFDKDLIRELAELLDETGLTEIEIEHEGKRVRVARTVTVGASAHLRRCRPARARAWRAGGKEELTIPARCIRRWSAPPTARRNRARRPSSRSAREYRGRDHPYHRSDEDHEPHPRPLCRHVLAILVDDGQPVEYAEPLAIIERG